MSSEVEANRGLSVEVEVDFDRSFKEAIKAGNYDNQDFDPEFSTESLPTSNLTGRQQVKVLLTFDLILAFSIELLNHLSKMFGMEKGGQQLVHPLVVLAVGEKFPDQLRVTPIWTLWKDRTGTPWLLVIGEIEGKRTIATRRMDTIEDGATIFKELCASCRFVFTDEN